MRKNRDEYYRRQETISRKAMYGYREATFATSRAIWDSSRTSIREEMAASGFAAVACLMSKRHATGLSGRQIIENPFHISPIFLKSIPPLIGKSNGGVWFFA
jgi:hypothetical protein